MNELPKGPYRAHAALDVRGRAYVVLEPSVSDPRLERIAYGFKSLDEAKARAAAMRDDGKGFGITTDTVTLRGADIPELRIVDAN